MVVLVSGPPGSGKTTLAKILAGRLGFVHLGRDQVKTAIAITEAVRDSRGTPILDDVRAGMGGEFGQRAFGATYQAAAVLLEHGASVIIDHAWRQGLSEPGLRPLLEGHRAAAVHTTVSPETARRRHIERGERRGLATVQQVNDEIANWGQFDRLDLATPTLEVVTEEGYEPNVDRIEAWIWRVTAV